MFQKKKSEDSLCQKGFSLTEIMIAIALLIIIGAGVATFITTQKKTTVQLSNSGECANFAQTVIESINSLGTRDNVLPAYLGAVDDEQNYYATYAAQQLDSFFNRMPNEAKSNYWGNSSVPTWMPAISSSNVIANSHLILSHTSLVEALYNSDPAGYCAGTKPLPTTLLPASTSLNDVTTFLKIEPVNDQMEIWPIDGCTKPLRASPRGTVARQYASFGGKDILYRTTLTLEYRDSENNLKSCASSSTFRHSSDLENNSTVDISDGIAGAGGVYKNTSTPHTLCDTQTISFDISFNNLEGGSVPLCMGESTFPIIAGIWSPCAAMKFPGQTGDTVISPTSSTSFKIEFRGLVPQSIYKLSVGSVDTAGNISSNPSEKEFIVDTIRPRILAISPITPGILSEGAPYLATPHQCDIASNQFVGTYQLDPISTNFITCTASTIPVAPTTVIPATSIPPTCTVRVDPSSASNARYSLTMTAGDACNQTTSDPYVWWALPNRIDIVKVLQDTDYSTGYLTTFTTTLGDGTSGGGFVTFRCDGDSSNGGATNDWSCSLTGQRQGNCDGVVLYDSRDVCGRVGNYSSTWTSLDACYPGPPETSIYSGGCGTRDIATNPVAPASPDLCRRHGYPYFEKSTNCLNVCTTSQTFPFACKESDDAPCCDECLQMCPIGHFYQSSPDCFNTCANNEACSASPPTNLGDPNCKYCKAVCPANQFITNDCSDQYAGGSSLCGSGSTCRPSTTPGCHFCKNNCPAGQFDDLDQPNCNNTCFGEQTCTEQGSGTGCRKCTCPAGETNLSDCGGCPGSLTCAPSGTGCYQCQCPAGTTSGSCPGGCLSGQTCVNQGSGCFKCENTCSGGSSAGQCPQSCASGFECQNVGASCYECMPAPPTPPPTPSPSSTPIVCNPDPYCDSMAPYWCIGYTFPDGCGGLCHGTDTGMGWGCFVAGTRIETANGSQNIEDLKAGDLVNSFNIESNRVELSYIERVFVHEDRPYRILILSTGQSLEVTDEHPFYHAKSKTWVQLKNLKIGDDLLIDTKNVLSIAKVASLSPPVARTRVYNIQVAKNSNYFANGVLVHNKGCGGSGCIEPGQIIEIMSFPGATCTGAGSCSGYAAGCCSNRASQSACQTNTDGSASWINCYCD